MPLNSNKRKTLTKNLREGRGIISLSQIHFHFTDKQFIKLDLKKNHPLLMSCLMTITSLDRSGVSGAISIRWSIGSGEFFNSNLSGICTTEDTMSILQVA